MEGKILLICAKLMHSETDDLLDAVGLTLWGLCNILTYRAAVLFGLDQDVRF